MLSSKNKSRNTNKVPKMYIVTAIITLTATKATSAGAINHPSSADVRQFCIIMLNTNHKSILAVTCHPNRNQKRVTQCHSIFNATVPCPRTAPTEHGTITKHNLQRINARPYPQKKDVASITFKASLHSLEAPTKRFFCRRCSWMPLSQTCAVKPHVWIGTIRKHNLQRMNATPCPQRQNMEQSQNTISKKCMQDHIHRRKMSTVLL